MFKTATRARHDALRDQLLAAAESTIAAEGLSGLRARALADTAGCSVGAIYSVFPDLDALILAVNGRTLDAIDATMRAVGGGAPQTRLVRLAEAYLGYAAEHRARWWALFQHQLPPGAALPADYAARETAAFSHVEAPLAVLRPDLSAPDRAMLARTLFSAVHGMVALGLDEKLAPMRLPVLRQQIRTVVEALGRGLSP